MLCCSLPGDKVEVNEQETYKDVAQLTRQATWELWRSLPATGANGDDREVRQLTTLPDRLNSKWSSPKKVDTDQIDFFVSLGAFSEFGSVD